MKALAFTLLLLHGTAAFGQSGSAYLSAVDIYASDPERAVEEFLTLHREAFDEGVRRCLRRNPFERRLLADPDSDKNGDTLYELPCSPARLRSAAMLHAEAADVLIAGNPDFAFALLDDGVRLVQPLISRDAVFASRWYAMVARLYLANGYTNYARALVTSGLIKFPDSGDLYVARGVVAEHQALPNTQDVVNAMLLFNLEPAGIPAGGASTIRNPGRLSSALQPVSNDYRKALALKDSTPHARLRLGWIHFLQRDGRARDDLLPLVEIKGAPDVQYLAHLLLGAIAERDDGLSHAISEYEAARRTGPDFQTGCVALSHAYSLASRPSDAHRVSRECLLLEPDDRRPDPWWLFRTGFIDGGTLDWLRARAGRQ